MYVFSSQYFTGYILLNLYKFIININIIYISEVILCILFLNASYFDCL